MAVACQTCAGFANDAANATLSVSVVIPVRNEEHMIGRCLDALVNAIFQRDLLQVVVVDNGSTDATVQIARSFTGTLDLTVLSQPVGTISALRNAGAKISRGNVLAFVDADCVVSPEWLLQLTKVISVHARAVIGSDYVIPPNSSWVARAWYGVEPGADFAAVSYVPAGNLVLMREIFEELGGFNETIQTNEDCEFCLRARIAGVPVYSVAALAVVHLGTPQTVRRFFAKQQWHGTHVFRVFRKNLRTLQNAKPLGFAVYTLLAMMGIVGGAIPAISNDSFTLLAACSIALLVVPFALAFQKAAYQKKCSNLAPLFLLFLLYGIGRAFSLMNPKNW